MASLARRRLHLLDIFLIGITIYVFHVVADYKDFTYAVGLVGGLGAAALTFFQPRLGLIAILALIFTQATAATINALADAAVKNNLTGLPFVPVSNWLSWGISMLYGVLLLAYVCRICLREEKPQTLTGLEWAMLLPLLMVTVYFPISMFNEVPMINYVADSLSMHIYAGTVVLARLFALEKDHKQARYFFIDWFCIFNILILIPLWGYIAATNPWRNGQVGFAAIRHGTGPYDFNFFLVPLLGMLLTYDDEMPKLRRRFYQFAFLFSLTRVIASLFRGAMAGTILAIIIASFLVDRSRRWLWIRSLLIFITVTIAILGILVVTVPAARATFRVQLLRRVQQVMEQGTEAGSLEIRQLEAARALEVIARDPVIGQGPGAYLRMHFYPEEFAKDELYLHSGYIWYWYKMGILGLGTILVFFIGVLGTCIKLLRRKLSLFDRGWVIATLSSSIAMLPVIQTNNMFVRFQGAQALGLLLFGLVLIVLRYRSVPPDELPGVEGGMV